MNRQRIFRLLIEHFDRQFRYGFLFSRRHDVRAKIDLFKETCYKFLSKINDPKIVTERLKKDIIKLVIDQVVIEGERVKIFATIPLPNKIHEREMDKSDLPGTFNAGATLGPVNETNMKRIWNKHKINTPLKKKVFVAMSGGVDSSVAAALLKDQDYEVVGVFMHFWHDVADKNNLDSIDARIENRCCSREAEESARKVAQKLGIKFYSINISKEFKKAVVDYFLEEYNAGRTPNPCVECNRSIKFGVMIDKALAMGADYVATGHYTRLRREIPNPKSQIPKFRLLKAKDTNKDQSYFLYTLTQKKLKYCLFPIGDYTKSEVREIARRYGLGVYNREESQEICFIKSKHYGDFLKKYLKLSSGNIVDKNGNILGEHRGLPLYTIGQRRDIGIGGTGPYYVVKIYYRKNRLIVSNDINDENLFSRILIAEKVNWISDKVPKMPIEIKARVRYRMGECFATVNKIKGKYIVEFSELQRAVMPGQSIVFYRGNEVLGGGIIKKVESLK